MGGAKKVIKKAGLSGKIDLGIKGFDLKRAAKAVATMGHSETESLSRKADKVSGGKLGEVAEVATGGMVRSEKTKGLLLQADQAEAQQQAEVNKAKAIQDKKDKKRRTRTLQQAQGRRSLLAKGSDELGVQRSTKLGG